MSDAKRRPRSILQWVNVGDQANIAGFSVSGEVFSFLGGRKSPLYSIFTCGDEIENHSIKLNGIHHNSNLPNSSYVTTKDVDNLYGEMTVLESLQFSQALRSTVLDDKPILYTLDVLGLTHVRGQFTKSITPGEKLKTLLAAELVTTQRIIMLEHPDELLNAQELLELLTALREFARAGWHFMLSLTAFNRQHTSLLNRVQVLTSMRPLYFGYASGVDDFFSKMGYRSAVPSNDSAGLSYGDYLMHAIRMSECDNTKLTTAEKICPQTEAELESLIQLEFHYSSPAAPSKLGNTTALACVADDLHNLNFHGVDGMGGAYGDSETGSGSHRNSRASELSLSPMHSRTHSMDQPSTDNITPPAAIVWSENACIETNPEQGSRCCALFILWWRRLMFVGWRAFIIRLRNIDKLVNSFLSGSVAPALGLGFTFYKLQQDIVGFQDVAVVLTVMPFGFLLCQNLCYEADIKDRTVFMYEREQRFPHVAIYPFCSILADILVHRIPQMIAGIAICYDMIGFSSRMESRIGIVVTLITMSVTGSLIARWFVVLSIHFHPNHQQSKTGVIVAATYCFMVLYAGMLLNLSSLPSDKWFVRDWSIFYWGCNNLFFYDNADVDYFAVTIPINISSIDTVVDVNLQVVDIEPICDVDPNWCSYCANGTYSKHFVHPNYTCSISEETDLCSSPSLNGSFPCTYEDGLVEEDSLYVAGDELLLSLGIPKIGYAKVYTSLYTQAAVYLALAILSMWFFQRRWTNRESKQFRKALGMSP